MTDHAHRPNAGTPTPPNDRTPAPDRRVLACLLAAGGLAAVSGPAQAGTVYSGLLNQDLELDPSTGCGPEELNCLNVLPFSIGDHPNFLAWAHGYDSFNYSVVTSGGAVIVSEQPSVNFYSEATPAPGSDVGLATLFNSGDIIGPDMALKPFKGAILTTINNEDALVGNWLGESGYVGMSLAGATEDPSDDLYGYVQLTVPGTFEPGSTLRLVDWRYSDVPGAAIEAGQCGAVPEPSVPSLMLLGLGAAGLAGWRRRRAAQRAAFAQAA